MAMNGSDVKKVRFFRDGDANFAGVSVAISKAKYRNFDSLLNDLSRKVPLPFGVRTLHTPGGIHHVYDIDQIQDGRDYVCSTFHARPIKKLDYVGNSGRPSWRVSKRTFGESPKQNKSADSGGKLFHARNIKPKTITVIAKDDSSNRARLILNRRTAMTYEGVLQTVSDILQLNSGAVKDLYTMEGKKIGGLSDLINGPDIVIATGRSSGSVSARSLPSRLLKRRNHQKTHSLPTSSKKANKRDTMHQQQYSKSYSKASPYTQRQSRGKDKKVKGNPYVFTVKTSDIDDAGTENDIAVVVYGSKGKTGELKLGPSDGRKFVPGSKEETEMDVGNIGKIYKMRVMHDAEEGNDDAGWHLQEIIMTSVARKNEELIFHCDKWFSNNEEEADSVRELAATKNGKALAKVTTYEISVITGEVASAGTDSNVFINIFGENGDTGKRWLKKSKNGEELFQPGSIDVFEIEAVSLDKITKILTGHDNSGDVPGWFLDKVLLKDVGEDVEYVCNCRKWLDEDEDDGKTERILKASVISDSIQSSKELWKSNEWKFQDSNEAVLISAANGKTLRINSSDGEVYAASDDGDDNDDTVENSKFIVTEGGEDKSRIFSVKSSNGTFNLTLDNGKITARQGKPGLLSEFFLEIHQGNLISLESVVHKGSYIGLSESDEVIPVTKDSDKRSLFSFKVKGILRNLGRIRLRPAVHPASALIESNGHVYGDGDGKDEGSEFVVHKVGKGVRAFQSATTDKFIRVNDKEIDCKGEDNYDDECQFIVHKDKTTDNVRLESVKIPGVFLGVEKHGRIKLAVDIGEEMTRLIVEVLSFGSEDVRKSSSKSQASYDYDDAFDDEAANQDKASSRGSAASDVKDKDYNYDSDNQSKHSRSASRESDDRPKSGRSSRRSARSSQSKRGSADSVRNISRPSSAGKEEDSRQASPAPDDSPNDEKEGDTASHLDPNAQDRDTYRTNTPANSVAGNSRPPSASTHNGLQKALSRIDNAEQERSRSSSRASRPSSRSSVKSPAKQTRDEEIKHDAEISRSNSPASDKGKPNSRSQTPVEGSPDKAEAEESRDDPEPIKDDSEQKSNAGSRASNTSRPGSANRPSQSRASSVGARSRKSSATKRDTTYEGLVNNHSRPASRSGSKASGKMSRSSSRRSETVGALEEQGSEPAEKNETAEERSSHAEAEVNEEQESKEDAKGRSTEEVAKSGEEQLNNNDAKEGNSESSSGEVRNDNLEDRNVTEDKQEENAEENVAEKQVSDKSAEETTDNNEENVSASGNEDGATAQISEELAEEDIKKEEDTAKSRSSSRQSVVSKEDNKNTEASKSRPASAEALNSDEAKDLDPEEDTKKPDESAADENQEGENAASGRESKVLSPTPPKTPRSSATPRRPSSRLSSRSDNSRPGSRSPSGKAAADPTVIAAEGSDADKGVDSEDNDRAVPKEEDSSIAAVAEEAGKTDIATGDSDEENKDVAAAEQAADETELTNASDKDPESETAERSEVDSENIADEDKIRSKDDDVKQGADNEDQAKETSKESESKDSIEKADSSDSNEGGNGIANDATAGNEDDGDVAGRENADNVNEAAAGNEENADGSGSVERQEELQTSGDDSTGKQEGPKEKADDALSTDEEDNEAKEEGNDEADKGGNEGEPGSDGKNGEQSRVGEELVNEDNKDDGQTEEHVSGAGGAEAVGAKDEEEVKSNEENRSEEEVNEDKDGGKTEEPVSEAGGVEDIGEKVEEVVKNKESDAEEARDEGEKDTTGNNEEGEKQNAGDENSNKVDEEERGSKVETEDQSKKETENDKADEDESTKNKNSGVVNEDESKQSEAEEDENKEVKDNNKENQESDTKDENSPVLNEDKDHSKKAEDENKEVKDNSGENQESDGKEKNSTVLNEDKYNSKAEESQSANSEEQAS